jgi:hypothetical protein
MIKHITQWWQDYLYGVHVGAKVRKRDGYEFPGEVRSVFATRAGHVRVVVECTVPEVAGMLHIFNLKQLEFYK